MIRAAVFALSISVLALSGARLYWVMKVTPEPKIGEAALLAILMLVAALMLRLVGPITRPKPQRRPPVQMPERSDSTRFDDAAEPYRTPPELQAILDEVEAMPGKEDRANTISAWALRLRSPFETKGPVTSWLGGLPVAPSGFVWPRDADGKPLHFIAQIDLADVKPEPETGARPEGLPVAGAMLVFVTAPHRKPPFAIRMLSENELRFAQEVPAPADIEPLREVHFWVDDKTFPKWPVDLVPYLDAEGVVPPGTIAEDARPEDWITTWGLAAYEAKLALNALEQDEVQADRHLEVMGRLSPEQQMGSVVARQTAHVELMEEMRPTAKAAIEAFLSEAERHSPEAPVDVEALLEMLNEREHVANYLESFPVKSALIPSERRLEEHLLRPRRGMSITDTLAAMPKAYRPFATRRIQRWREHRLFGQQVPEMTDWPDLRGLDCVISIGSDRLLETQTEHESGFSIWGPREAMAEGDWDRSKVVWHINV